MEWSTVASIATAVGVLLVAWQIHVSAALAQTRFEDEINEQYRAIAKEIPVDALIGRDASPDSWPNVREMIYNYLDLSNEQAFLRSKKRVRKNPWQDWRDGIEQNLSKPAFERVWQEVKESAPDTFSSLERLELEGYKIDPATWR